MDTKNAARRPDCFQCRHFTITWDPRRPRACKLFGFKSAGLPSLTVFQSTGEECVGFVKKDGAKPRR